MKKIRHFYFFIILAILLVIFLLIIFTKDYKIALTSSERSYLKDKKTIIFVSQTKYPPFEFIDENKTPTGMAIELAKWISTEFGFKAKFIHTSFYNAQQMILKGDADILTSFFYSKERDKKFDFTKIIFHIPASIFVTIDNTNIKSIKDLNGKKIAIQKGDYAISFLKSKNINFQLVATKNFIEATDKLINNEADALVGDEQIVMYYMIKKDLLSKVKIVGNPLYVGLDSFAVKDGNKILLSILDKGIKLAQRRGIITSIEKKWLGSSYSKKGYRKYFYIFLLILLIFLIAIVFISLWNITLKKKIEEKTAQLIESEKQFRGFFEQSLIPYLLIDKGKFIDCNQAAVNFIQAKSKKDLLVNIDNLSPKYQPDGILSVEKAKKLVNEVFKTGEIKTFEWVLKSFTGKTFWAYIILSLVPYKNRDAVLVTWVDITELKQLQQLLEKEKQELETTLKSIGDAVIKVSTDAKIELMNPVAEKLTGWKFEEAKNKHLDTVFKIFNSVTKEKQGNPVDKVLKSGKIEGLANHTVLVSRNGIKYHIADSAAPIKNDRGKIIGVILVFRDVTEKIQREKELLKAEKLRSIGILAGGIAHDFNNMLTSLFGYISLAKEIINKNNPAYDFINKAEKSIEKATSLTKQLLTFSKGGEPILEDVDINVLIKETVKFNLSGSNIRPVFKLSDKLCKIYADKGQVSQVIANLTINAKEAMEKGGKILIYTENAANPLPNLSGNFLKIVFKDEGKGIPINIIDKIFDPYFTTKKTGNGLGLTTVYSIIKKHDGEIFVESQEGIGTTFTIFLPAELKNNGTTISFKKNFDNKNIKKFHKLKILAMDDKKDIRSLLIDILTSLGHDISTCSNGDEAIKMYKDAMKKNEMYDLVILDLTIPGGKGGETTIQVLKEINPNIYAIVASGYSESEVMSHYKKYGFKDILIKPYTINELKEKLSKIV